LKEEEELMRKQEEEALKAKLQKIANINKIPEPNKE
jgi:hypothetical protein